MRALAARGLDTLRIPVGDWMWAPYGPYTRCTDGARAQLQRLLRLCARHGLRALLDLHCVRGSQNGMDNSGRTTGLVWSEDGRSFEHWTVQGAEWLGGYNATADRYAGLDYGRLERALGVLAAITDAHAHDPTVVGLTPLNEPYGTTPLGPLQRFYWEGYKLVQRRAPHWLYPMHPRMGVWPTPGLPDWSGFMRGWCAHARARARTPGAVAAARPPSAPRPRASPPPLAAPARCWTCTTTSRGCSPRTRAARWRARAGRGARRRCARSSARRCRW